MHGECGCDRLFVFDMLVVDALTSHNLCRTRNHGTTANPVRGNHSGSSRAFHPFDSRFDAVTELKSAVASMETSLKSMRRLMVERLARGPMEAMALHQLVDMLAKISRMEDQEYLWKALGHFLSFTIYIRCPALSRSSGFRLPEAFCH